MVPSRMLRVRAKTGSRAWGLLQAAVRAGPEDLQGAPGQAVLQPVAVEDLQGVLVGGPVRHGGAAGDHVQVVAHHVREQQAQGGGRGEGPGQAPALDAGQVLAHAVQFVDGGPAAQEQARHLLLVVQGEPLDRGAGDGRAAAGDQADGQGPAHRSARPGPGWPRRRPRRWRQAPDGRLPGCGCGPGTPHARSSPPPARRRSGPPAGAPGPAPCAPWPCPCR